MKTTPEDRDEMREYAKIDLALFYPRDVVRLLDDIDKLQAMNAQLQILANSVLGSAYVLNERLDDLADAKKDAAMWRARVEKEKQK